VETDGKSETGKMAARMNSGAVAQRIITQEGMFMRQVKDEVVRLIQSLPDDCTVEEIQYHLYVRQKVENGLAAAEEGRTVAQEEAERRVEEWLKSLGPNPR
jgi:hypothetical protein